MNGTEIRIVSAEPKQLAEVLDLISRFYREEGFATNRDQMEEPVERLLRGEGGAILLALSGSFPAGVAALATAVGIEQGGLGAELTDLYVHPDFRSHGIARKLIEQTIEWCRQHGVNALSAVITPEAQAANNLIGFYTRFGLRNTGRLIMAMKIPESH